MANETNLLRIDQVANRLQVSKSFAYLLVERGEIPCVRLGRAVRVPAEALNKWLEDRTEGGESDSNQPL